MIYGQRSYNVVYRPMSIRPATRRTRLYRKVDYIYLSLQTNNNSKAFFSYFLKTNFLSFLLLRQMEPILLNTRLEKIDNTEAMENIEESKLVAMDLGRNNWEQSEAAIDGEFVLLINLVASRFYAPNDA